MGTLYLNAISLSPAAQAWLANLGHPRILQVFDLACNLIDERGDVLSVVTPQIGNGPFNLVIKNNILFSEHLDTASSVSVLDRQLLLGSLIIHVTEATLWQPRPNWNILYANKNTIRKSLINIGLHADKASANVVSVIHKYFTESQSLVSYLSKVIANADVSSARKLASKLAGLGSGLTPSGDDILMGAMYAAWIIHPPETAAALAGEIVKAAAPLTTSLSAAWLRAAGRGEAGCVWHAFFEALLAEDGMRVRGCLENILSIGATSGADALAGFVSTVTSLQVVII